MENPVRAAQRVAYSLGLKPAEFWELTPAETFVWIDAQQDRLKSERALAAWVAWNTAAYQRSKRMPKFETVLAGLGIGKERKRMTREEYEANVEYLLKAFGGEDRRQKAEEN